MTEIFRITSTYDSDNTFLVSVHNEDSIKLIKLLADQGILDYTYRSRVEALDTNDYAD